MKNEHPSLTSLGTEEPVLKSISAQGKLEGLLLSMTLRQSFRNDSAYNMEVVYTFPLAWGSVLLSLEATLGGKRMTGQVMARQEARERYEDAVEKGDAPVMVEKSEGNVFSASLGSLKPGEEATIELSFAQLLAFEQGRIRLIVPTTIAPRYGDALTQGKLSPDQAATPSLTAEHRFGLSLTLCGAVGQARIGSPTHTITLQRSEDGVTVELQGSAWLDRDFVLLLEGLEGRSFALACADTRSGEGHAALVASYCPVVPQKAPAALRLKVLVDCSGSMAGDSINQAREALRPLANMLKPEDQISLSHFGSQTQRVLSVVDGTPANIKRLLDAINTTEADLGGTELASALQDTFSLHMGAAHHADEADVLLITDGEVWDAQRIVEEARRSGHRVYALGVGSAPAESLLREMAEATGGACEFATPQESMAVAVQRLMARIRLALPVQARLESTIKPMWCSPMPRRLTAGETVHLFMRLPAIPERAPLLDITGLDAIGAELTIQGADLIARLVAAREIGQTVDRIVAAQIAEHYQLVTDETNLLLVIERTEAEKTDGMPALHKVQPMLAAGWGGSSTVASQSSQVMFSISQNGAPGLFRRAPQSVVRELDRLAVASAWRSNRRSSSARVDALASGGMDDFEIPTSLDTQSHAAPDKIIQVFNQAAAQGEGFRKALRAVTDLTLQIQLCLLIVEAARHVGGPLKAWASYLLWLHDSGLPHLQLTVDARTLALDQVGSVPSDALAKANSLFSAAQAIKASKPR